jgi:predicted transcriptional regulator
MKGEITLKILETLAGAARGLVDATEAFLSAGYGASYSKLQRESSRIESRRVAEKLRARARNNYAVLISKLKSQGIIEAKQISGEKRFFITKKGKEKLFALRQRRKNKLPAISGSLKKSGAPLIVAFDIPEKQRRKRDWLRIVLGQMGLTRVQRSIWMGKGKLPEEFLDSLYQLDLIDCVEIFEVGKTGTLKHVA